MELVTALAVAITEQDVDSAGVLLRDIQRRACDDAERRALGAAGCIAPIAKLLRAQCSLFDAMETVAMGADGGHGMTAAAEGRSDAVDKAASAAEAALASDAARFVSGGVPRTTLDLVAGTGRALRVLCVRPLPLSRRRGRRRH